jgi:glutathione peroxidase
MKHFFLFPLFAFALFTTSLNAQDMNDQTIYQFTMKSITGEDVSLEQYKGKTLLVVNVASECGYTPQYEDLEALYEKYSEKGLVILGFPANNFGGQEPGSDEKILNFCTSKFHVTFPMFSKISVKGDEEHPLYHFLTHKDLNGVSDNEVKWNFNKFLISPDGHLVQWFPSKTKPLDEELTGEIEKLLH